MAITLKIPREMLTKLTGVAELAKVILDHVHFAKDGGGRLYRYRDGTYLPDGNDSVARAVQQLLELGNNSDKWSRHKRDEVTAYINTKAPRLWAVPRSDTIHVLNGLLDVTTLQLGEHDPDFLSSIQLPVTYDPDATCPAIDRFFSEVAPADTVQVLYQIAASLIMPFTGIQQAILLYGEGGNGKSTLLDMLVALLGTANISTVSLQQLQERFFAANLVGKLANICADLPSEKLRTTATFKNITGGDLVTVERKHEAPFNARIFAKLIFSANHLPVAADRSEAYYRRWVIIPFPNTFRANPKTRRELVATLTSQGELSGFFNKTLQVLPKVLADGIIESESMTGVMQEFRGGDQLEAWLNSETVMDADAYVMKTELWERFKADTGCGMTQQAFGRRLRQLRPNVGEAQRTVQGQVVWVYTGLELRTHRISLV